MSRVPLAKSGSTAIPCTPLWPSQNRSGATSADPPVPNSRTVLLSARRADTPRHFSVNSITPSGVKAMSHGSCKPAITTVRVSFGASADAAEGDAGDRVAATRELVSTTIAIVASIAFFIRHSRMWREVAASFIVRSLKACKLPGGARADNDPTDTSRRPGNTLGALLLRLAATGRANDSRTAYGPRHRGRRSDGPACPR